MIAGRLKYRCVRPQIALALSRMRGWLLPESITAQPLRIGDYSWDTDRVLVVNLRPNVTTTRSRAGLTAIGELSTKCRVLPMENTLVAKTLTGGKRL